MEFKEPGPLGCAKPVLGESPVAAGRTRISVVESAVNPRPYLCACANQLVGDSVTEWCRWLILIKVTENGKIFLFRLKIRERAKTTPRGGGVVETSLSSPFFLGGGRCKLTWKSLGRVE